MNTLKKIYDELVLIRKELRAIRESKGLEVFIPEDSDGFRGSCESTPTRLFPTSP